MAANKINVEYPTFQSFILSSVIYLALLVALFFKVIAPSETPKKYTDTKDSFMDVMIVKREEAPTIKAPEKEKEVVPEKSLEEKKVETPKEEVKTTNKETSQANLKSLFQDINITKKEEKKVPTKTSTAVQTRKPSDKKTEKEIKKATDIIKGLELNVVSQAPSSQSTGEYNEYIGSVARILNEKWSALKADTDNKAVVKISIDTSGKFSYNIVSLSYNSDFNQKVRDFLADMVYVSFPPSQTGKPFVFDTTLEDKITTEMP